MPGRPFGWPGTVLRSRIAVFPLSLDLPGDNNPTQSSPKDKNLTEDIENLHIIVCLIRKIQVVKRLRCASWSVCPIPLIGTRLMDKL